MALSTKSFNTLVSDQVTAIQALATSLVDLTIGSLLRSVAESNAGVLQWLQSLIVQLLVTTRAATCSGDDLVSWMADYGFTKLSAVQSTGQATFSRYTSTYQALIPIGTVVQTTDGTQQFTVITDTTNAAYSATLGGYVIVAGVSGIQVPIQASTAGAAGNVLAGTISVIVGGIQYVDTVTNASALANGSDEETDAAFRARFVLWVASLSKGTKAAIGYALSSMQTGVTYSLVENQNYNGTTNYGYFYAVVDDGSGSPSSTFLSSAANAIESARGFTINYGVFAPTLLAANVSMTITTTSDHASAVALVSTAVQEYIAALSLGQLLPYTQLATIAYGASPLITNVSSVLLNGGTSDLAATAKQVIRAGTIAIS
jgi:uncharacterized phage protein gp47/JayE